MLNAKLNIQHDSFCDVCIIWRFPHTYLFHRLVGHFLTLSPEYCFVLEESEQIVGYVLACLDAKSFYKQVQVAWMQEMKRKYPKTKKKTNLTPAQVSLMPPLPTVLPL